MGWGKKTTKLDLLLKKQKKYLRLITFSKYDAPSNPLFIKLKILNIYNIYLLQLSEFMYKKQNNYLTCHMSLKFEMNCDIHDHDTRQAKDLHMIFSRTKTRQLTIQTQGILLWNSLPKTIINAPSLATFKRKMKLHLLLKK